MHPATAVRCPLGGSGAEHAWKRNVFGKGPRGQWWAAHATAEQLGNIPRILLGKDALARANVWQGAGSLFALEAETKDREGDAKRPESGGGALERELVAEGEVVDESADKGCAAHCLHTQGMS